MCAAHDMIARFPYVEHYYARVSKSKTADAYLRSSPCSVLTDELYRASRHRSSVPVATVHCPATTMSSRGQGAEYRLRSGSSNLAMRMTNCVNLGQLMIYLPDELDIIDQWVYYATHPRYHHEGVSGVIIWGLNTSPTNKT